MWYKFYTSFTILGFEIVIYSKYFLYTTTIRNNHLEMAEHYPETSNSRLGEIVEVSDYVPHYAKCRTSIITTGKVGCAPGELNLPIDVAIHKDTHQIFVVDYLGTVEIFSETGEFLYQLDVGQLIVFSIAIHGDSVYFCCPCDHSVSKYSLTKMCRIKRIAGEGSNSGQFNSPDNLTTDTIGRVFIADTDNDRICIHDPDLNHLRNITHQSMFRPTDVNISRDCLYVLCKNYNPCMHVLTLEGDKLYSLITCGEGMDVLGPTFFCFDPLNNFVMSDSKSQSIRVFSQQGNLLHTIRREGNQSGIFNAPLGVAVTPSGRLVCVSWNNDYRLHIFY